MIDPIVTVNITIANASVERANFGTPLILGYHTEWLDRTREYSGSAGLTEMVADGFATTSPLYLAARALLAQRPHPASFKIGRRALPFTQKFRLYPKNVTETFVYLFLIGGVEVTYTVPAAATIASVTTALEALIEALADITSTDGATYVEATVSTAGVLYAVDLGTMHPKDDLIYKDVTVDPGIATDLDAVSVLDDAWYGLIIDSNSPAEIEAAVAWLETKVKIGSFNTTESESIDPAIVTDLLSDLQAAAYTRSVVLYAKSKTLDYRGAAWMGEELVKDAGRSTWAFKTLAGITVDALTLAQYSSVQDKGGNTYTRIKGRNVTFEGHTPSGEFIDIMHFVDWLHSRIQENVYAIFVANEKVPYTDEGIGWLTGATRAALDEGVKRDGLRKNPSPVVTAPLVADVDESDRSNRIFPDIEFTAELVGAVHKTTISGTVSF